MNLTSFCVLVLVLIGNIPNFQLSVLNFCDVVLVFQLLKLKLMKNGYLSLKQHWHKHVLSAFYIVFLPLHCSAALLKVSKQLKKRVFSSADDHQPLQEETGFLITI